MSRPIDADRLYSRLSLYEPRLDFALREVENAPTMEEANYRSVGRWIDSERYLGYVTCSECHDCYIEPEWVQRLKWRFCPSCGARLEVDQNRKNSQV